MKKIITVFDGSSYAKGPMDFVAEINNINPVTVTGIFLSPVDYSALWSNPLVPGTHVPAHVLPSATELSDKLLEENMIRFEQDCIKQGISFRVHDDTQGSVFEELKKESRYADLMVLSSEIFYSEFGEQPNSYMKEVLHNSECPVLLMPEKFKLPQNLVLSYDGSESSVYAIRQFAYILPELCRTETILVSAGEEGRDISDLSYIEELAARHFPNLTLQMLEKDASIYFRHWLADKPSPMLVAGSYGRSSFSQIFKKSFVNDIIREHLSPVFLTHK